MFTGRTGTDLIRFVSFVRCDRFLDANDFAIAEAIVGIGHVLNMKVIAEGVETETQMKMLQEVGGEYLQGYYFSKPAEPDEVFRGEKYRY